MLLIACKKCSRQYDATGLEPGTLVRCFCEELFSVGWPTKLVAKALSCTQCGGAVSATDNTCPYCRSAISEEDRRQTTLCPGCYTRIEDDSQHCRACGISIQPQALQPLPADRDCPRCNGGLRIRSLDIIDVIECGDCLGMWLNPDTFDHVTRKAAREAAGDPLFQAKQSSTPRTGSVDEVRYIPCLTCGELMQRRQYTRDGLSSRVIIDLCREHGVWLDNLEVERISEFIRSRGNTGSRVKPLDPAVFIRSDTSRNRGWNSPVPSESNTLRTVLIEALLEVASLVFRR